MTYNKMRPFIGLTSCLIVTATLLLACSPGSQDRGKTYSMTLSDDKEADSRDISVIDWRKCEYGENSGCIKGNSNGAPYRFGFNGDPNRLVGVMGQKKIEFVLNTDMVESFGNGILELPFTSEKDHLFIIVNWNSNKQKLIGHDLGISD